MRRKFVLNAKFSWSSRKGGGIESPPAGIVVKTIKKQPPPEKFVKTPAEGNLREITNDKTKQPEPKRR